MCLIKAQMTGVRNVFIVNKIQAICNKNSQILN